MHTLGLVSLHAYQKKKKKKRSSLLDLQSSPRGCIGFSIGVQTVKLYLVNP